MRKKFLLGVGTALFLLVSGATYCHFSKPTVSVIMATYNRADLLSRAIKSILNQTYKDFEFIIVDDGSTDHTEKILTGYAKQDSRIKIIKNEKNEGLVASRNKSLELARGKYIAIMDSDDQAFPNRLEKSLKVLKENPDVQAVSGATYDIEKKLDPDVFLKWDDYHKINNDFSISMMFKNTFPNPAAMFRSEFIKKHNIKYDTEYEAAEDYDFWKQFIMNGGKIITIYEPLTLIRRHSTNVPEYYEKMAINSNKIHAELISRFYKPEPEEIETLHTPVTECQMLEKISHINEEKNIIDQESLTKYRLNNCPKDSRDAYYVKHLGWEDFISKEGDGYVRHSTKEKVDVQEQDDILILTFENIAPLKFKLNIENGYYQTYGDNTFILKHNYWEDEMYLINKEKNEYCRFSNQDCGILIKKGNGRIEIKWNNPYYDVEKFEFDKKENKYIQK